MKYFISEEKRKESGGTCYFEFQKGKFKNKFWMKDSICLYADLFDELDLYQLFSDSLGVFDYYGINEVSQDQWRKIIEKSTENEQWKMIIEELKPWVEECFVKHKHFTVCGI